MQLIRTPAIVVVLLAAAVPLRAQVRGTVSDSAGHPVAGALVELYGAYERVAGQGTDSLGQFRFGTVPASAALLVRAIGFAPVRLVLAMADTAVSVILQPLPVEMTELRVSGGPAWCPPQDDPRARALWARAASHYDIALSSGLIRSWTLVFAADVPSDSFGLMDTTRLRRVFMGDQASSPRTGWRAFLGPAVPFLESLQAWQFGDRTFAEFNRLAFPPGSAGDTVIAWCSQSEEFPFIRGTLTLAPDTTFATASFEFATPEHPAQAGGRVLFARTDPGVASQPMLAMAGFYWRKHDRGYFQQWMEFREWTRCESSVSCRTPVRLADRSIAVLTFARAPEDSGAAYLAEGLADGVAGALAGVGRLKVVSRDLVRRTPGAADLTPARLGELLGAANLVSGTVQRVGGRLRVMAEVLHAASGERLWVAPYDTSADEVMGVVSQIAAAVAARVVGQLLPGERMLLARRPTSSPVAYHHYLRGNRLMESDSAPAIAGAIAEYEAALHADSAFAAVGAPLALAYAKAASRARAQGAATDSLVARGLAEVNQALAADSSSAAAWLGGGWLLLQRGGPQDLDLAPEALRRAVALDAMNALAHQLYATALLRTGRFDDAQREFVRTLALDPGNADAMAELGFLAASRRTYGAALLWFDRLEAVDSTRPRSHLLAALARMAAGDTEAAFAEVHAAYATSPRGERLRVRAITAELILRLGAREAADSLLRRAVRDLEGAGGVLPAVLDLGDAWPVAHAAAQLGHKEVALSLLDRVRPRGPTLWSYLILEGFDPIRADPRFKRLLDETRPPGALDPI